MLASVATLAGPGGVFATSLRIVSYNIDDADQGNDNNITASYAGLPSVIQAIGQHHIGSNAQPVDVLGVEELNATTLTNLTNALNNIYGAGTYAFDPTADPTTGGGTDGLIYNTHTVQIVSAEAVGTVSTSGASRAPLRYEIRPVGYGSNADFYMYVSHYKASSGSSNIARRNAEATEIRADADALGPNAHVIYSGDFNLESASSEAAYKTLTSAGNGHANDPTAASLVSNWTNSSSTYKYLYSESSDSLDSRFDFQLVSDAMLNQPGLRLATDTSDPYTNNYPSSKYGYAYEVFGNNGTTNVGAASNLSTNTSLSDLPNASTILNDLMDPYAGNNNEFVGSDHLPVVADYNLVGVNPLPAIWLGGAGNWSNAALWSTAAAPNNASVEVEIDNGNAQVSTVTLDQDATVGDITLDAADSLAINATRTLTITGFGASALSGAVNNSGAIVLQGGATHFAAGIDGGGSLNVAAGATMTANHIREGSLTVAGSASIDVGGGTSRVATLSITGSGKLDLTNNKLIVTSGSVGAWNGSNYDGVSGLLKSGRNGGAWNGSGIVTSETSATSANPLTTLAVASAGELGKTTFGGISVSPSDVLVMYTYAGDANLDGRIDADDYFQIDSHFNDTANSDMSYVNGDFNYDGLINGDDYFIIDSNFSAQGAGFSDGAVLSGVSSVPEPAAMSLLIGAGLLLGGRRRRA